MSQAATQAVQQYWDKHDISKMTLAQALNHLEFLIVNKITRGVVTLIGDAGVGKTQGVHALARKHDYRVVDFRTSQFSLLSAGIPQKAEGDHFKIAVPEGMPKEGERVILLFDEINRGTQNALAMFLQLLEDRCLYNYKIPDDTVIVALMNPATADYAVSRIESDAALNRRLRKFYVYSTFQEWLKHARTEGFHYTDGLQKTCHPVVQRFLTATPSALYDDKARGLGKQYPSPATWQTVSLDFWAFEANGIPFTDPRVRTLIAGSIGNTMAHTIIDYVAKNETLLSATEILHNYRPDSKIRKVVLEQLREGGGDIVRLQEEVPTTLFADKPPLQDVAKNFALFIRDLSDHAKSRAEALYTHLKLKAIKEAGVSEKENMDYMAELNMQLRDNEDFQAVHEAFAQLHAEMTGQGGKDPMV